MEGLNIFSPYIKNFLLIFLRAATVIAMLPFFGSKSIPPQFKIGIIIALTFVLTPIIEFRMEENNIPLLIIREVIFGIILGLAVRFIFLSVEMMGQIISNAMGLSIATVFNPEIGQSTEVSRFYGIMAMLIFLSLDVHHEVIYVFVRSYEWLPAGQLNIKNLTADVVSMCGKMFIIALKMGAPVIIVMLITNLVLGFVSKAAPQMNIFFVGYPVYILVGIVVMALGVPVFVHVMGGYFSGVKDEMYRVISLGKE